MKRTVGNFLSQSSRTFPVDCELFAKAMQDNQSLLAIIGNLAGNKAILYGCGLTASNTEREAGYVYVRTVDYPQGEILYYEGGLVQNGMHVQKVNETVVSNNVTYTDAYTVRSLVAGVGTENYSWNDFHVAQNVQQLYALCNSLQTQVNTLQPMPVGSVIMWAGAVTAQNIPAHYLLCDGSSVAVSAYPALYAKLGTLHNTGSINGYFNLPDLRSRFIVGYDNRATDYNLIAKKGGQASVTLAISQLPSHAHSFDDYYFVENNDNNGISGKTYLPTAVFGCGRSDSDNHYLFYKTHNTAYTGGGAAHENRPPFYTLAFLIRAN